MIETTISVIIPIYNAGKYLDKAIESVLRQGVEVILVNDGSTDSSFFICNKYAEKNDNVKVIHQENRGVPTARNAGIRNATGKYISFLDADDYVNADAYEQIRHVISKYNPDCIDFGWNYVNECGEITSNLNGLEKNRVLGQEEIREIILPPLLNLVNDNRNFIYDYSVNKIYKKEIIEKYDLYFDEKRRTWEDRVFLIHYLKYCKSFCSMDKCFYNYVSVPNSLSRRYDLHFFDIILQNYHQYVEWFGNQYDFDTQYVNNYWCHSIENMIYRSLREEKQKEQIRENVVRILKDEQVVKWYANRELENEQEALLSQLVVQGDVEGAISVYKNVVKGQKNQEKWNHIKAKIYAVRKVFKA